MPKVTDLIIENWTSHGSKKICRPLTNSCEDIDSRDNAASQPAKIPMAFASITTTGNMIAPASTRGTTRYATGS